MNWVKGLGIDILNSLGFGSKDFLYDALYAQCTNEYGFLKYNGEVEWQFELANYGEPQGYNCNIQIFYFWGILMSDESKDEFGFVGTYDVNTYELKSLYELEAATTKNIVRSVEK